MTEGSQPQARLRFGQYPLEVGDLRGGGRSVNLADLDPEMATSYGAFLLAKLKLRALGLGGIRRAGTLEMLLAMPPGGSVSELEVVQVRIQRVLESIRAAKEGRLLEREAEDSVEVNDDAAAVLQLQADSGAEQVTSSEEAVTPSETPETEEVEGNLRMLALADGIADYLAYTSSADAAASPVVDDRSRVLLMGATLFAGVALIAIIAFANIDWIYPTFGFLVLLAIIQGGD